VCLGQEDYDSFEFVLYKRRQSASKVASCNQLLNKAFETARNRSLIKKYNLQQLPISSSFEAKDVDQALISTPKKNGKKTFKTFTTMLGGTVVDLQSPTSPDEIVPKPSTAIQTLDLQVDIATSEKKFKFSDDANTVVTTVFRGHRDIQYADCGNTLYSGISLFYGLSNLGSPVLLGTSEVFQYFLSCKLRAGRQNLSLSTFVLDSLMMSDLLQKKGRVTDEEKKIIARRTIERAAKNQIIGENEIKMVSSIHNM
jgi:hypothetical protein